MESEGKKTENNYYFPFLIKVIQNYDDLFTQLIIFCYNFTSRVFKPTHICQ